MRLIRKPRETINKFTAEFKMVMNCHRERKFLLLNQPHLTHWIPIAVPLTKWIIWPPPFDYPPAALGPLGLFPLFFKFYDALGSFASPPSHIMTPARTKRKFPQMINTALKYCSGMRHIYPSSASYILCFDIHSYLNLHVCVCVCVQCFMKDNITMRGPI